MKIMSSWDIKFLKLAREISSWSKDPSTNVGAIVVGKNKNILSTGYNGFPRGIKDDDRLNDRETKYSLIVHAELNAIYNATYNGVSLDGATLYIYGLPLCSECVKGVVQVGIKEVVMCYPPGNNKWSESFKITELVLREVGIKYKYYLDESLSL